MGAKKAVTNPINSISDLVASLERYTGEDAADQDLRASLEAFGWDPLLPAIQDEHGLILSGNRRMAVAKELGIEPPSPQQRSFGVGEEADKERLRIFIAGNAGSKPWSLEHRKAIARFMKLQGFSYRAIGEQLKISERQAWEDTKDASGAFPDASVPDNRAKMTGRTKQFATLLVQERAALLRRLGVTKSKDADTFKEIAQRVNKEYSLSGKAAINAQIIRRLAKSLAQPPALQRAASSPSVTEPAAPEESGESEIGESLESESGKSESDEPKPPAIASSDNIGNGHDPQSGYLAEPEPALSLDEVVQELRKLYARISKKPTKRERCSAIFEIMAITEINIGDLTAHTGG